MRKVVLFFVAILGFVSIMFVLLRTPDTDPAEMREKYGSPASQYFETDDGQLIHYRDEGCRSCPALLSLHGSNASLHLYEPIVARLGERYRIITYDHPGHGLSGEHPRNDYSANGLFETLEAVAEEVGVEGFTLGGTSMGGWLSWRYALRYPERVDRLILMNASGAPKPAGPAPAKKYLAARIMKHPLGRQFARHLIPRSIVKKSAFESVADPTFVTQEMVDRYWDLARLPSNRRAISFRATADREPSYGERLTEIAVPTLIIWGAQDKVTPAYNAVTFGEMIPDSRIVMIEGAGHIPMEETPDQTSMAIDAFLEQQR